MKVQFADARHDGTERREEFSGSVASVLLDTLRGVAALLVCIGHWRYLFFVNYPQLPAGQRKLLLVPYALCSLGHVSVIVFFVLSGYLVGGQALRAMHRSRWTWKQYLFLRGVRLYVVLLPALLLGGAIDRLALHLHLAPLLYHGQVNNFLTPDVSSQLGWKTLLGNVTFLQEIFVPTWGSNGPLWSLSNEFWYYLLFPCILIALSSARTAAYRISMTVVAAAILILIRPGYMAGFAVWMLGAALTLIPTRVISTRIRWWAVASYVPLFILSEQDARFSPNVAVVNLGAVTTVPLWIMLGAKQRADGALWMRGSEILAGFSYTLYLIHVPILTFFAGVLVGNVRWVPSPINVLDAMTVFSLVLTLAFAISLVTEARTPQIKNWLLTLPILLSLGSRAGELSEGQSGVKVGKNL